MMQPRKNVLDLYKTRNVLLKIDLTFNDQYGLKININMVLLYECGIW